MHARWRTPWRRLYLRLLAQLHLLTQCEQPKPGCLAPAGCAGAAKRLYTRRTAWIHEYLSRKGTVKHAYPGRGGRNGKRKGLAQEGDEKLFAGLG